MAGIHLHTHDVLDEGPEAIRPLIGRMDDLEYVFVQVNTIFERNPSPIGILERNPLRPIVVGNGALFADVDIASRHPRLYQRVDPGIASGQDPLQVVRDSSLDRDYTVVPWLSIMNGDFLGDVAKNSVVDYKGQPVRHWLCPNGPDVVEMWAQTIDAIADRYGYSLFMIDRIRFPDWAGRELEPRSILSCFCDNCVCAMEGVGLDSTAVRTAMDALVEHIRTGHFEQAATMLLGDVDLGYWQEWRRSSVTNLVTAIVERARQLRPDVEFWIDVWPPAYAAFLGQDYGELTRLATRLKHFPYHRLGGGADVQGLIESFSRTDQGREAAFQAFLHVFGLDYDMTYAEFRQDGFPSRFVGDQNARARETSTPGTEVFSGVQMWNLPPEELRVTAEKAYRTADDVIYYCYGWAATDLFGAANGAKVCGGEA